MCLNILTELADVAELLSVTLRNPAVGKTSWKMGYRQVSFRDTKKRRNTYS